MSEAELLEKLKPEAFQAMSPGDRYHILAHVGRNPTPALTKARYEALKPWIPTEATKNEL